MTRRSLSFILVLMSKQNCTIIANAQKVDTSTLSIEQSTFI
ncbi:uncharacterized protein METZ01_LOCUS491308, partial [marine metagenome]